jgi:hypothetical protein
MSSENLAGFLGKAVQHGREVITRLVSPKPFLVLESTSAGETWQGTNDDEMAEIVLIAGPNNTAPVDLALYGAVGLTNYIPLNAKDSVKLGGIKYSDIHLKFADAGDMIHIMRVVADGPLSGASTV